MAKFIHSDKLSSFKSTFTDWNNTSSATYKAIAFIDEGYIVTHGQIFSTGLGAKDNPYGLEVSNADGKLKVTVGGYSASANVLIGAKDGEFTSASVENGNVTINHKKTKNVTTSDNTEKGTNDDSETNEFAKIVSYINYDEYGHLHSASARNLILNKVKSISDANTSATKRYLLGHSEIGQTDETYANSKIYFTGSTLYVGDLKVGNNSITDLISASQALYFKGTIGKSITNADNKTTFNTLPAANVKVGDLYVVGTGGYTVTHSDNTTDVCEAGDMIIATATTPTWAVVQRNLENALTESNLNGTTSGNELKVYKKNDGNLYVNQTDTNTWRAVKIGGTEKLGDNDNTALNFLTGQTGISISYNNGIKIINSSPLSNAKTLTLKYCANYNDITATDWTSYTPITGKTLTFKAGKNITLSSSGDILTITAADAPTHCSLTISGSDSDSNAKSIDYNPTGAKKTIKFGSNLTTTVSDDVLTVNGTANTWRNVSAYLLSGDQSSAAEILSSTIGTADLAFGSDFVWTKAAGAADGEIQIGWCEITTGSDGTITKAYAV